MAIGLGIGAAVAVLALVAATVLVLGLRRRLHQARAAAHLAVGERAVLLEDTMANCFGRRSLGPTQGRGNGTLLLTHDALIFAQAVPARTLEVPRSAITAITTPRSFLGKTKAAPLLQVDFTSDSTIDADTATPPATGADAAAWLVRDLPGWLDRLGATTDPRPEGSR